MIRYFLYRFDGLRQHSDILESVADFLSIRTISQWALFKNKTLVQFPDRNLSTEEIIQIIVSTKEKE